SDSARLATALQNANPAFLRLLQQPRKRRRRMVAAFPGPRLRHFQKQGSVKQELSMRRSRVYVELQLSARHRAKWGVFGRSHWKYCSQRRSSTEVAAKLSRN